MMKLAEVPAGRTCICSGRVATVIERVGGSVLVSLASLGDERSGRVYWAPSAVVEVLADLVEVTE